MSTAVHTLWPHQQRTLDAVRSYLANGGKALAVTSPTGSGKTVMQTGLIEAAVADGQRVVLYTNRRMLFGQTHGVMRRAGIEHGLMAAGYTPDFGAQVQIASIQTIASRVYRRCEWELFQADLVIVDEAHQFTADEARRTLGDHRQRGAAVVGFTATPVGLGGIYERLYIAARKAELFKQGILVKAITYSPDEVDLHDIDVNSAGEFSQEQLVKRVMIAEVIGHDGQKRKITRPRIFGRVLDHYKRLNPDGKPTILFAPGVKESIWFAQELQKNGITAAHIDAETPDEDRERIAAGSQSGDIEIVCNRFVLREGVDWPWLGHMILATGFGAFSTYCQVIGRGLRRYEGKQTVTVQDHGGNYHRHGSPNADWDWELDGDDKRIAQRKEQERVSLKKEDVEHEPIVCPQCNGCRIGGHVCPHCGFRCDKSVRNVIQTSGKLKKVEESIGEQAVEERRAAKRKKLWTGCMFAAWHYEQTFRQAYSRYCSKYKGLTGDWPPHEHLWNMPDGHPNAPDASPDWSRLVSRVLPELGRRKKA